MAQLSEDNPAGRLYAIFADYTSLVTNIGERINDSSVEKDAFFTADGSGHSLTVRDILWLAFAGRSIDSLDFGDPSSIWPPDDYPARFYGDFAQFLRIPSEIESRINSIESANHELFLSWREAVYGDIAMLSSSLATSMYGTVWDNGRHSPTSFAYNVPSLQTELFRLGVAAEFLHQLTPEPKLSTETIDELVALVRQTMNELADFDDLPPSIRLLLLDRLREVEHALVFFRMSGHAGIQEAVDKLAGVVVREPSIRTQRNRPWFEKLWKTISFAATSAKELQEGVEATSKVIESIGSWTQ